MFKTVQRTLRALIVLIVGGFTIFFIAISWFVFGIHLESRRLESPRLAFWMEHAWASGGQDFSELQARVDQLPITDLFFHVGPLTPEGRLAEDLMGLSSSQLQTLKTTNYAWIGQIRNQIALEDPSVRAQILKSSEWILSQGFDGIHLNIEPVRPDDAGFFSLLSELRAAFPTARLSVAMDEWQPHFLSRLLANFYDVKIESYWNSDQVKRVSEMVDQMVVMTYDTNFHDPHLYAWWVEQQVVALSKLMWGSAELFIGIPSYANGISLDPATENVQTGLWGVHKGVTNIRSHLDGISGIAIYSYWEMDEDEWAQLKSLSSQP